MLERLQKVMAKAGIASRRKCEDIILAGRVTVDGKVVKELGTKVDLGFQRVEVDEVSIKASRPVVYILNKPRGIISSVKDDEGRKTVIDILKKEGVRLFPVGRLDYNTSGALLLTNDGELAHALTHPSFGAVKKYLVKFRGAVSDNSLDSWKRGVVLEDGTRTRPVVDIARIEESDGGTWVHVAIKEGKNKQIRRMAEATDMQISKLKRVSFAGITIDKLPVGHYRKLTAKELDMLVSQYSLTVKDHVNRDKPKPVKPRRGKSAEPARPGAQRGRQPGAERGRSGRKVVRDISAKPGRPQNRKKGRSKA